MDAPGGHPLAGATEHWEATLEDAAATAEEYRERGWTALELRPGDVTVDPDLPGFDVLVGDDEFADLTDLLESGVDGCRVYRGSAAGVLFAVVAVEASAAESVVLVPLYYTPGSLQTLQSAGEEAGRLATRLRRLDGTEFVVDHANPELFFPDPEDVEGGQPE